MTAPTTERTLCIIKPDAIAHQFTEAINEAITHAGLRIVSQKEMTLTLAQAQAFYAVHKERPFYESLCRFMTSGPICVQLLEGKDAVKVYRKLMGDTTLRKPQATRCVSVSGMPSKPTRCMALIALRMLPSKSSSFFPNRKKPKIKQQTKQDL